MTLIADAKVFEVLPVKTEAKVVVSGIYITEIKSLRGKAVPPAPKKKKNSWTGLKRAESKISGFCICKYINTRFF